MKYYPRLKVYKNSSGTNYYNPETNEAHSYGHWCYFRIINGIKLMNNSFYSSSTCKHQRDLRGILTYDLEIKYSCSSLHNLQGIVSDYVMKITTLQELIMKPRTKSDTNLTRWDTIMDMCATLRKLKELDETLKVPDILYTGELLDKIKSLMNLEKTS